MATSRSHASRDVLVAVSDVLVLAEPLLLQLWKGSRVTLSALRVLRALVDQPHSPGELAAATGTAAPTMARLLTRLEERGFLTRSIDASDRRRIEVRLTATGLDMLNRTHVLKGSAFERAADRLSPADRARLVADLEGFAAAIRALAVANPEPQEQPA